MTTTQLVIVSLTVLSLALICARVRWMIERLDCDQSTRLAELAAADKARGRDLDVRPSTLAPADGSVLAVHFDDRVVQGTLEYADDRTLLLRDASLIAGTKLQPLGGRQHIPRSLVTQIQELG